MRERELELFMHVLIYLLVFLANWGAHWFPWRVLPILVADDGRLRRILAYVYGTLSVVLGMMAGATARTLMVMPTIEVWYGVRFVCGAIVAAGLGTMIPYALDERLRAMEMREDLVSYEQTITRRS